MSLRRPARTGVLVCWFIVWTGFWLYPIGYREVEVLFCLALVLIALVAERRPSKLFGLLRGRFARLARHRRLAVAVAGLTPLLLRAALLPIDAPPVPLFHDEASYLLASDTFASGRVTNPQHPMWVHLESIHVNHTPNYASKYPPGQGLVMALGQRLGGDPWIGVWLSTGMMCAALCWMLQGWLPAPWALLGALLAAIRLGVSSYWMDSYWGGSVAAIGGALVLGAYPRLRKNLGFSTACALAIGLVILANSRPYEGLVSVLPVGAGLAYGLWLDRRKGFGTQIRSLILPVVVLLSLAGLAMAYYNVKNTGSATQFPYTLHRETYSSGPLFFWQDFREPPEYRHEIHRSIYIDYTALVAGPTRQLSTFVFHRAIQFLEVWHFFLGALFVLPVVMMPYVFRDHRMRLPLASLGVYLVFASLTTSFQSHYWAPVTGVIWLLLIQAMRHLQTVHVGRLPAGTTIVFLLPAASVLALMWCQVERLRATPESPEVYRSKTCCKMPDSLHPMYAREIVKRSLEKEPGRHLVIVHYVPGHRAHEDWVFNRADIDGSKTVWAYDMGVERNRELLDYFDDRTVWLAEPDVPPYRLTPYSEEELRTIE